MTSNQHVPRGRKQTFHWTLYCFLMITIVQCGGQEDEYTKAEVALRRVLDSMSSALDFMNLEHNRLNLDAVIGLRIVEGQLKVLLKHLSTPGTHRLSDDIVSEIQSLQNRATAVSNRAIPFIKKQQTDYYNHIGFIINENFWTHDYPSTDLDTSHVQRPLVIGEALREAASDKCLEELRTDKKATGYDCEVSTECWNKMTAPGYRYYSLSHEIFYLQIGQATGCFNDRVLQRTKKMRSRFCSSMLVETRSFSNEGYPSEKQDLFMEEAALCGIYGYRQFFTDDWLEKILSWQRSPRGCWGMTADDYLHGRSKREERVLPDGCECHRTAVALSALTQYVRYVIEYMHSLSGFDFF